MGSLTYLCWLQKTWAASENMQGIPFTEGLQFSCFTVKLRFQEYFLMSHWREILGSGTPHSQFHWEFESETYWLAYLTFGRLLGYMEKCCTTEVGVVWTYKLCVCGCCWWSLWQEIGTAGTRKGWRLCANTACFPLFILTDKLEIKICLSQRNILYLAKKKKGKRVRAVFFLFSF